LRSLRNDNPQTAVSSVQHEGPIQKGLRRQNTANSEILFSGALDDSEVDAQRKSQIASRYKQTVGIFYNANQRKTILKKSNDRFQKLESDA